VILLYYYLAVVGTCCPSDAVKCLVHSTSHQIIYS